MLCLKQIQSKWFILKISLKTLGFETWLTSTEQVYPGLHCFFLWFCFLNMLLLELASYYFLLSFSSFWSPLGSLPQTPLITPSLSSWFPFLLSYIDYVLYSSYPSSLSKCIVLITSLRIAHMHTQCILIYLILTLSHYTSRINPDFFSLSQIVFCSAQFLYFYTVQNILLREQCCPQWVGFSHIKDYS